ncbi:MAG TPA: c-type cytochrome biogenesis protein CcmI [Burkholderiales bacterium]|nr:c-type cytochrome biogenesis protein CcmI [Burkholderiales bacterium]
MTLFVAIAAALTAAALLFLLPPLLRRRTTAPDARVAANAAIYREQLDELAAELQGGAIAHDEFERASREIEHRIVAEHADGSPAPATHRPPLAAALALGLLLPLVVALGYWQLGEPRALSPESAQPPARQMEALAQRLSAQLQQKPDDAEGWTLLARALASLGKYEPAAQAYARALQLQPENRDLLVEFVKALAMAGSVEFDARNYAGAVSYWERILHFAPPDSEFARTVNASIAEARQLGGISSASLQGIVSLDPALKKRVSPGDTVFVLARPVDGPKMPLAVVRTTVEKLPYAFTLDDSMAMAPGATISSHQKVVVAARISKSGNALSQKGDIEGTSAPVVPGASDVKIVISRIVN